MSLHMNIGMARLTVIGTGWSNTAIDSGDGFTDNGDMWWDIAGDLDYDFGNDVDWDLISDSEYPDFDWSDVVYTDPDGNIYTDPNGTGIWTDPTTGLEYPGTGDMWIPEDSLLDISDSLGDLALEDSKIAGYSIPDDVLPTLYGGKVSTEIHPTQTGSDRPHRYNPPCWYLQTSSGSAQVFLGEPFVHTNANGGNITVYDDAFTTRDGSTKAIYYSGCNTHFTDNILPSPYNSYPVSYVAWQCVYGSLGKTLISTNDNTITSDSIKNGTSGLDSMDINGTKYYKISKKK